MRPVSAFDVLAIRLLAIRLQLLRDDNCGKSIMPRAESQLDYLARAVLDVLTASAVV